MIGSAGPGLVRFLWENCQRRRMTEIGESLRAAARAKRVDRSINFSLTQEQFVNQLI